MKLAENLTEIIIALIALFAVGVVIKVVYKKNKKSNKVNQKNIHIEGGGDVVGRDKITKDHTDERR